MGATLEPPMAVIIPATSIHDQKLGMYDIARDVTYG